MPLGCSRYVSISQGCAKSACSFIATVDVYLQCRLESRNHGACSPISIILCYSMSVSMLFWSVLESFIYVPYFS